MWLGYDEDNDSQRAFKEKFFDFEGDFGRDHSSEVDFEGLVTFSFLLGDVEGGAFDLKRFVFNAKIQVAKILMVEASAIGQSRDVLAQAVVVLVVGFEFQETVFFLQSCDLLLQ